MCNYFQVVLLVCKRWREAGESRKLWSTTTVHVNSRNIVPVSDLMEFGRLSRVRTVRVEKVTEDLLEVLKGLQSLEEVNFCGSSFTNI